MYRRIIILVAIATFFGLLFTPACDFLNRDQESPVGVSKPESSESGIQDSGEERVILGADYIKYPINPWSPITNPFGRKNSVGKYHVGDDCVRSPGTPVYAIYTGYVRYARNKGGGWGYLMIVESYFNNLVFCTVYGHLGSRMYPGEGQWVSTGQYIGTVGSTAESGQSTPHLHLGIHYGSYGTSTGRYPSWCCGYSYSTSGWFNPTSFISRF